MVCVSKKGRGRRVYPAGWAPARVARSRSSKFDAWLLPYPEIN